MYREKQVYTRFVKMIDGAEHFFVSFFDGGRHKVEVEVSREIYNEVHAMRCDDERQWMEQRRHYEHLELSDVQIEERSVNRPLPISEIVEKKELNEAYEKALVGFSDVQKRRIIMYLNGKMSLSKIALHEGCSKRAVQESVETALGKLKKILANFN